MPTTVQTPRASLPTNLAERATRSFYAWKALNAASAQDPRTAYIVGFQKGFRESFLASVELSGLREVLLLWVQLLEEDAIDRDVERSAREHV